MTALRAATVRRAIAPLVVALTLAACSGGATPIPSPSPSPAPSPSPSPVASIDANGCPSGPEGFQQSLAELDRSVLLDGQPIALRLASAQSTAGYGSETYDLPAPGGISSGQPMAARNGAVGTVAPTGTMTLPTGAVRIYPEAAFSDGKTPAVDSVPAVPLTDAGNGALHLTWPATSGTWVARFELGWTTQCLTGQGVAYALVTTAP